MNWIKELIEYIVNIVKIWIIIQPWEMGLRVRFGKHIKTLSSGMYFRIPYIDSVYVQSVRIRVVQNPLQTLTTKDGKTISICCLLGYSIVDIKKLYETLHQPESTLSNISLGKLNEYIYSKNLDEIQLDKIEIDLLKMLNSMDYGINFEYVQIANFACVRTYRLIQDTSWMPDGISLDIKK